MSQKVKRGGASARKASAARGTARKVSNAKARTGSLLDRFMAWQPLSEFTLQRGMLAMVLGGAVALAWFVASLAGVPAMATQQIALIAKDAGFEVHRVEVRGVKHLNDLKVYEQVLAARDQAMPLVDIDALRGGLLQLSWVEDARVSRQLPDTLVIDIVERTPHAVLAKPDKLVLIDAAGHELEPVSAERARGKLVLSGPGAGRQVAALGTLLEAAPALKPQVKGAEWVGNRRWNLTFKSGQVLALPEGNQISSNALIAFAKLDGTNRLLGGRVAAFDMRAADRIYLRVPGRVEQAASDTAKAALIKASASKAAAVKSTDPKPASAPPAADAKPTPSTKKDKP